MRPQPITLDQFDALIDDARSLRTPQAYREVLEALGEKLNAKQWDAFHEADFYTNTLEEQLELARDAFLDAQF